VKEGKGTSTLPFFIGGAGRGTIFSSGVLEREGRGRRHAPVEGKGGGGHGGEPGNRGGGGEGLARAGGAVAVNYFQSETAAGEVVAAIREVGGTAIAVQADVRDALQCEAMADR